MFQIIWLFRKFIEPCLCILLGGLGRQPYAMEITRLDVGKLCQDAELYFVTRAFYLASLYNFNTLRLTNYFHIVKILCKSNSHLLHYKRKSR